MAEDRARRCYYVLTALGTDRPGIVATLTEFLERHGCNIEESRMAILGGEFGLLMLVSMAEPVAGSLTEQLPAYQQRSGLELRWKETESPQAHRTPEAVPYRIRTYALDHEGIIHAISQALSELGVNIVSAATSSYPAPVSGTPLFQMEMEVDVPRRLGLPALRRRLDAVAIEQNADIELSFEEVRG